MAFLNQTGLEHLWAKIVAKLSGKVDKIDGKGLSTNDYTTDEKNKLAGIAAGANKTVVDSALSSTSTNPVQNKVVNTAISNLNTLVGDTSVANQISTAFTNQKGVANGVATLDSAGKVPSTQLPSYVDDVIEGYYSSSKFYKTKGSDGTYSSEITGETGKIYVDLNTNKTYRWSGSAYTVISETLALGTTSSTAFRGDYGNTAYTHATAKGSAFSSGLYKITTNAQGHVTAATAVAKADITGLGIPAQDTTYSAATTSAAGLMSASDKTKLDGIATGANKTTVDSALSSTSTNPVQNKVVNTAIANLNTLVGDTAVSTQITNAASSTTPKVAGTAAVGTETMFARGDHVHPAQTTVSGNAGSATKLATARTIDGVSFNGTANITHYGTCDTAAGTAAKVVALTGFTLATGAKVAVKFTVTNTAANPTLNVNSTGAKAIYYRGAAISAGYLAANRVYEFVYDGTNYELIGDINVDTNTDTKVTNTLNTTAKAYVTGTTSASTNTGTQVFDTGVYLDTTAGQLTATTFKGALSGNASTATKATQDANGNVITSTYATKTELSGVSTLVGDTAVSQQISTAKSDCITGLSVSGKVITYTKGNGDTGTITTQDTNTTYSVATTSANGLMSSSDKAKLNGVATGAEVNQNAFSNIVVGSTTVAADSKTDTLTFVAGSNITLTPDATNDKITIAAADVAIISNADIDSICV